MPARPSSVPPSDALPLSARTVLLVDDEPAVLAVVKATLERGGFPVLTARNGREGFLLYERHRNAIHIVLTDVLMPVVDGLEMAGAIRARDPDLPILAMTGMSSRSTLQAVKRLRIRILRKPLPPRTILQAIADSLEDPVRPACSSVCSSSISRIRRASSEGV